VAAIAALTLAPAPAAAVTQVNACADLTKAGETYILTGDITSGIVCFRVLADRITLDLAGHTITGPGTGGGSVAIWDNNVPRTSTVVKKTTAVSVAVRRLVRVRLVAASGSSILQHYARAEKSNRHITICADSSAFRPP
jgi:hypothetical protein